METGGQGRCREVRLEGWVRLSSKERVKSILRDEVYAKPQWWQ